MNKNISVLFFVAFSFLLRISLYGQINLKTEQLNNWELGYTVLAN
ncbi:hypothetical protein [Flavobacterium chilense]|uniref:Uncharacterized protein n=1 Tax=Flavobacterium chilense TaxID=946677 RepID=A0A1M7DTY0_9FLAO|nr:hypothetical protein [Flavobacterium chilense]SHL82916.1 hypothetical protein SAMN05444484_102722 [Flavobacterium chilense]